MLWSCGVMRGEDCRRSIWLVLHALAAKMTPDACYTLATLSDAHTCVVRRAAHVWDVLCC